MESVTAAGTRRGWPVGRAALVGGAAVVLALLAGLVVPQGLRLGVVSGALAGGLGGGLGLFFVARAAGRPFNELLLAQLLGFFVRILLVGAGVVLVRRAGGDWAGFVASFFFLFFLFTALEAAVLGVSARPAPPDRSVPQ